MSLPNKGALTATWFPSEKTPQNDLSTAVSATALTFCLHYHSSN